MVLVAIPLLIWANMMPLADRFSNSTSILLNIGRAAGIIAVTLYSINLILSTRLSIFEDMFGGLNKVFFAHHLVGGIALCIVLLHPVTVALSYAGGSIYQSAKLLTPFATNLETTFGILGMYLFVLLMIITFFIYIPYRAWLLTHKFLGAAFILIALHVTFISSDTQNSLALRTYLLTLLLAGIVAYTYRTLLPRFLVRRYSYKVDSVEKLNKDVVSINLKPNTRGIDFKPGQFVFVQFKKEGLPGDWHPFSISSNSPKTGLQITVKSLGELTSKLVEQGSDLDGTEVLVEGSYGRFNFKHFQTKKQIWIAGGIGITPFLGMAKDVRGDYKVNLFYSVKNREEFVEFEELKRLAEKSGGALNLIPVVSEKDGLLDASKVKNAVGDIDGSEILICGPPPMMKELKEQFKDSGIKSKYIHTEEFNTT